MRKFNFKGALYESGDAFIGADSDGVLICSGETYEKCVATLCDYIRSIYGIDSYQLEFKKKDDCMEFRVYDIPNEDYDDSVGCSYVLSTFNTTRFR